MFTKQFNKQLKNEIYKRQCQGKRIDLCLAGVCELEVLKEAKGKGYFRMRKDV